MTRDSEFATRPVTTGSRGAPPANTTDDASLPGADGGDSLNDAQSALDRVRQMRSQIDRVLGGLNIQDARNLGGQ